MWPGTGSDACDLLAGSVGCNIHCKINRTILNHYIIYNFKMSISAYKTTNYP
jgi:hypothetical protein